MVLRLLLFFALAYLLYSLLRLYFSSRRRPRNFHRRDDSKPAEEMVLDPQCQSYLPKGEAISRGGHYFCSEQCARLYLGRQTP